MKTRPGPETQDLADILATELDGDSTYLSKALFGDVPDGTTDMGEPAYFRYAARNWQDANWRKAELNRIGAEQFLKMAHAVVPTLPPPITTLGPVITPTAPTGPAMTSMGGDAIG